MQVLAFSSRVVRCPTVRTEIKREIKVSAYCKQAVRLIITRRVAAEESSTV